ncbi:MAG: hypothetical protein WKG07_01080 [Hymenobacter sp.]
MPVGGTRGGLPAFLPAVRSPGAPVTPTEQVARPTSGLPAKKPATRRKTDYLNSFIINPTTDD